MGAARDSTPRSRSSRRSHRQRGLRRPPRSRTGVSSPWAPPSPSRFPSARDRASAHCRATRSFPQGSGRASTHRSQARSFHRRSWGPSIPRAQARRECGQLIEADFARAPWEGSSRPRPDDVIRRRSPHQFAGLRARRADHSLDLGLPFRSSVSGGARRRRAGLSQRGLPPRFGLMPLLGQSRHRRLHRLAARRRVLRRATDRARIHTPARGAKLPHEHQDGDRNNHLRAPIWYGDTCIWKAMATAVAPELASADCAAR
jgi:hypothetical protein